MGAMCAVDNEGVNYSRPSNYKNTTTKSDEQHKDDQDNIQVCQVQFGAYTNISIVLGHYSNHCGEALICLTTSACVGFCEELREYLSDVEQVVSRIRRKQQKIYEFKTKKSCPYSKLIICLVPEYIHKQNQEDDLYEYEKDVRVTVRTFFQSYRDVAMYFTQTSGQGLVVPNQTVIALILKELCTCIWQSTKFVMISPDKMILQMIRYEILKTEVTSLQNLQWNIQGPAKSVKQNHQ